jgi:glycosyltransferase involved in cell wall biosynthesis
LVLVPTLNDFSVIDRIVRELDGLAIKPRVLVIDDGSKAPLDPTSIGVSALHIRLPANFGLGVCTHIAFDHALAAGYDAVVRVDSDGQHPVHEVVRLLEPLEKGQADLVVATRTNRNLGHGLRHYVATAVRSYFSLIARLLTHGKAPSDVNSGFFAVNARGAALLNKFLLERYPEPQIYVLGCRHGLRIAQIEVLQTARLHGASSLTVAHALRLFYRFNIFILAEVVQGERSQ